MILDASHKKWAVGCAALGVAAAGLYALQAWLLYPSAPSGGSLVGLWLGILGTLLLAAAGLLPLRKWYPLARLGSAQSWLRAHIWFSLLGSWLILLHSAFAWRGTVEQWLMLLLGLLVASGIWGWIAQWRLTRQLTLHVPLETFYENLPQVCRMLQFEGDVLLAKSCEEPLPLAPDLTIATDQRLKNRGVGGQKYPARLGKVYAQLPPELAAAEPPARKEAAASVEKAAAPAAASVETPQPAAAAAPKALSPAEKIALMRAKKAAPAEEAAPAPPVAVMAPSDAAAATGAPAAPKTPANPKALGTADKLALMRAARKPAAGSEQAEAPPAPPADVAAQQPAAAAAKIKLPAQPRKIAPPPASPEPPTERKLAAEALRPFQRDLRTFFLERVRPFLAWRRRPGETGFETEASASILFARQRAVLPQELHEALSDLESLCAERRELSEQARIYHWLHGWLVFVHIPAAAALLALVLVHIAASFYW